MLQNALTRWTPTSMTGRDPFTQLFDELWSGDVFRPLSLLGNAEDMTSRAWLPAVDVRETAEAYHFVCDLPGLSKEDVQLTLENGVLTISGERRFEKQVEGQDGQNFHRVERRYGKFTRSFTLPGRVNAEGVQAAFENGVLTVTVPKLEEARPRRIEIH